MNKVSVLIPTYNCARYITEAIESVLNQTYRDFEIIVVDDGSTDNTKELLLKYISEDKIKYFFQNNMGVSAATNTAFGLSNCDLIAFLNADDIWFPDKLKLQVNFFLDHPEVSMVHSNVSIAMNDSITTRELSIRRRHKGFSIFDELYLANFVNASTVVLRRECLNFVGLWDESLRLSPDYDLWLRIAANFKVGYQDVVMGIYRLHGGNISRDSLGMNIEVLYVLDKIRHSYPQLVSKIPKGEKNNRYLRLNYSVGYEHFCKYDLVHARKYFLYALRFKKTLIPIYIYLLSTYLNLDIIEKIRIIKRKIIKLNKPEDS